MTRERIIAVCGVFLSLIIAVGGSTQAALALQGDEPSPEPPTSEPSQPAPTLPPGRLVTVTPVLGTPGIPRPTPTLEPAPSSGGRVAVDALYVRDEPAFSGDVVGIIPYGQSVYPVGRNGDGSWIAINWASARGWVYGEMVSWDPALDLNALPILVQSTGVPPTPTSGPSETPTTTATLTPSQTLPPSATPAITVAPTIRVTATRSAGVAPTIGGPATAQPSGSTPGGPSAPAITIPSEAQLPLYGGLGILVLAGAIYYWQWSAGRAEVKRYAKGFVLSICPVCQEGHIHLDEVVRTTAGIPWVRRSARCDTCNSVLRELRPGLWRYSIDAYANPELAERFKSQRATTAELQELARNIVLKPTRREFDESTAESLNLSWLEIEEPLGSDEVPAEVPTEEGTPVEESPETTDVEPKPKKRSGRRSGS
jgi:hypothetical protein